MEAQPAACMPASRRMQSRLVYTAAGCLQNHQALGTSKPWRHAVTQHGFLAFKRAQQKTAGSCTLSLFCHNLHSPGAAGFHTHA